MTRAKTEGSLGHKIWALGLLVAALMAASLLLTARPAHAEDFVVTNSSGSGTVEGSLVRAISDANANPGPDTIKFNIPDDPNVPGNEVKTISLSSGLPTITEQLTIDGYTQPGSRPNSRQSGTDATILIEISGANAGSADGLSIRASNVVVRGLAINRFGARHGISIFEGTSNKIEGNFIGTDATGNSDRGNSIGVFILDEAENNTIGGTTPEARNLISGNNSPSFGALSIRGKGSNRVQGNLIGTLRDGTGPMSNSGPGLLIDSPKNTVGGAEPSAANTIALNFEQGVLVQNFNDLGSTGNRILNNSIFFNGDRGIDLDDERRGREQDPGDRDKGANTRQNFPVLSSAEKASGGKTTIKGTLESTPGKKFTVQFFSNPQNEDEGKTFLGKKRVTTNRKGQASFTFETDKELGAGENITATATGPGGNTSEFSDPRAVEAL